MVVVISSTKSVLPLFIKGHDWPAITFLIRQEGDDDDDDDDNDIDIAPAA
ncbi:hypothetical protein Fmac_026819 [Flemingia macrophylla]|uniref:Uncharacterized protein n=1 Tax=Flemingia macrophylla TaxID=520843 RepID=A0ABD1LFX7_9FABA